MNSTKSCEISGYLINNVINFFEMNGYAFAEKIEESDTVIINTCCVTQGKILESEDQIRLVTEKANIKRIFIFGCLASLPTNDKKLKDMIGIGPKDISKFNDFFPHKIPIEYCVKNRLYQESFIPYQDKIIRNAYYVLISQGCANRCSYCNIKLSKGNVVSKKKEDIIQDIKRGVDEGRFDFVLIGDDCGSYGFDIGTDIVELIKSILAVDGRITLKIRSFFPARLIQFYPSLKEIMKTQRINYVEIPMQSGSKRILSLMTRNYDPEEVVRVIKDIRKISPKTWIYTHMILNFPTETREDFMETLKISRYFDESLFITYSENPLTPASKIEPKVDQEEQKRRIALATELIRRDHRGCIIGNQGVTYGNTEMNAKKQNKGLKVAQISVTNRCQCNCKHCGVSFLRKHIKDSLSLQQIEEIFKDLKTAGCEVVDLFGGEPTLRKDLFEIIELAKAYELGVVIETNGLLLTREYLTKLKKSGLDKIYLSLDDYDERYHDERRGLPGTFKKAVNALNLSKEMGIPIHVSIVPIDREYFINGNMNKFIEFCLKNGAEKIRILLPRLVGNSSSKLADCFPDQEAKALFNHIDKKYFPFIYAHSEDTEPGEINKCAAKKYFCHIDSNGWVFPCPYFPLVFGDATRESITTIFGRIQNHPVIKAGGEYCPTRNPEFMEKYLSGINETSPYIFINNENMIYLGAPCNNGCIGCEVKSMKRSKEEILKDIEKVNPEYGDITVYGGEPFLNKALFEILAAIPKRMKINLHTNGRALFYSDMIDKLKKYNISSVNVPFFSPDKEKFEKATRTKKSYEQTVQGIKNLCEAGFKVNLHIPQEELPRDLNPFIRLGVSQINAYELDDADPLPNSVRCFGKRIKTDRVCWIKDGKNIL
ncbi:MAG: radical SAM protein [Nanoarchaeota archaeon]|nr:radical SAM protein [Nanoarchaeota archaeon]